MCPGAYFFCGIKRACIYVACLHTDHCAVIEP